MVYNDHMRTPTIIRKIFGKRSNATVTPDRTRELAKVLEESPTTPNDVVPNFLRDEMVSVDDALQHFWEHVRKPIYEKYFGTLAQAKEALFTAFASREDKNAYSRKINKLFESEETLAFFGMVFPSSESLRELPRILFFVELVYEYMSRTAILNARGSFMTTRNSWKSLYTVIIFWVLVTVWLTTL